MQILFAHGWGYHGGVWEGVLARLGTRQTAILDLGFVRGGPKGISAMPEDVVCVGHSFGLMWLLKHGPEHIRGLVSISGFDCFHAYRPAEALSDLRGGLERNPAAQMRAFWQSCGTERFAEADCLDAGTLRGGLEWLGLWDERERRRALDCPVLVLASEDDAIVPKDMSAEVWQGADLRWCAHGGHGLPLTAPAWCAAHIDRFVDGLAS